MLKICCNKCGRYQGSFIDFFDVLEVKEHILICSLIQHDLLTFEDFGFQGSTDSCAQSWIPVNKFSRTASTRYVNILIMKPDVEVRWTTADGTVAASVTTYLYGAFLEIKYYLESIRS